MSEFEGPTVTVGWLPACCERLSSAVRRCLTTKLAGVFHPRACLPAGYQRGHCHHSRTGPLFGSTGSASTRTLKPVLLGRIACELTQGSANLPRHVPVALRTDAILNAAHQLPFGGHANGRTIGVYIPSVGTEPVPASIHIRSATVHQRCHLDTPEIAVKGTFTLFKKLTVMILRTHLSLDPL